MSPLKGRIRMPAQMVAARLESMVRFRARVRVRVRIRVRVRVMDG